MEGLNYFLNPAIVPPFQLIYQHISVTAINNHQSKSNAQIVRSCSGKFQPKTSTAILGPSGCGKTTFLNCISGWTLQENLQIHGHLKVNGKQTQTIKQYQNYVSYVMQDPKILNYFTVFQTFKFIADMRILNKTNQQKNQIINQLIQFLDLQQCQQTFIGNNLEKGISGGQLKRTAIGIQLLKNPSIIFLDEPTTGLDSYTALQLIIFLQKLAKSGRTVVYTIHQPSSEIFHQFDKLILMAQGQIIYNGDSKNSIKYFQKNGIKIKQGENPSDFYLKMLHKEGIMLEYQINGKQYTQEQIQLKFKQKINKFVKLYQKSSQIFIQNIINQELQQKEKQNELSLFNQFKILIWRSWIGSYRNPYDLIIKLVQSIINSLIIAFVFGGSANFIESYLQNIRGLLFLFSINIATRLVLTSASVFSFERQIYIRQRFSNTYTPTAYFLAKTLSNLPVQIFYVVLYLSICYFFVNLNNSFVSFIYSVIALLGVMWLSSSLGFFLSTLLYPIQVIFNVFGIVLIPALLLSGYLIPFSTFNFFFKPWKYLSITKYGYQALIHAQFTGKFLLFNGSNESNITIDSFDVESTYFVNMILMFGIGILFRILSFLALIKVSTPKIKTFEKVQNIDKNLLPLVIQLKGNQKLFQNKIDPSQSQRRLYRKLQANLS